MKKRIIYPAGTIALSLFIVIAGATLDGRGQSEDLNSGDKGEVAAEENIAYLMVSSELARIAEDSRDAILMLAAARLEAMAVSEEETRSKTSEGGTDGAEAEAKPEEADLYALAEEFAGTNEQLHAVIEDSRSSSMAASRGRAGGPGNTSSSVLAYDTDVYQVEFRGGRLAEVFVSGDGDTDLDLRVYDEFGSRVCQDLSWDDQEYCSWSPRWTGPFRVEIENLGGVYNVYTLLTN